MARRTRFVDSDILIVGGGFGGCGAAYESRFWGRDLNIVLVEKANIERSGAVAQGLSAINCYMGMQWNENQPEDFVRYARGDLMGLVREDLVYDIARHVDSTVHKFEEWGLPIIKDPEPVDSADQIMRQVKFAVANGALQPGQRVPSLQELASTLALNPNTVARAYRELELAGIVTKRRTAGTYVSDTASPLARRERLKIVTERIDALLAEARQMSIDTEKLMELIQERDELMTTGASKEK